MNEASSKERLLGNLRTAPFSTFQAGTAKYSANPPGRMLCLGNSRHMVRSPLEQSEHL